MTEHHHPTQTELEALFVNNADLDKITAHLNRFNPIRVMRMEGMEIRHSAILAWLLDPIENHGFGDAFLRAFISQALRGAEKASLTALEVSQADLRDAEIQREKRNIDLFVSSPSNGWAFIIENKFHSKQSDGQLSKYLERAEMDALEQGVKPGKFVFQGIFLTLNDEAPSTDIADRYVSIKYADICDILNSLMKLHRNRIGPEAAQFLNHYLEVIRDATGMNDEQREMELLARKLYQSHRKALDFIWEYGETSEFEAAATSVFGENFAYGKNASTEGIAVKFNWISQWACRFLPTSWIDALGGDRSKPWPGCEGYWAGFPVICWFELRTKDDGKGTLFLYAELGNFQSPVGRAKLVQTIAECAEVSSTNLIKFRADAASGKTSKFFDSNKRSISDVTDEEEIATAIRALVKKFSPAFSAVETGLRQFEGYKNEE